MFNLRKTVSSLSGATAIALCLGAFGPAAAANSSNQFCGGPATPTVPSDLANVVGDQTLQYAMQQPASIVTCAKGYLLSKCGDHESANKIFDKCIAAGYVGAMIWKALLLDEGAGVEQDSAKAAELLHRAAVSGDPAYGPLGKMHYATVLQLGRGVEKNEAEALTWFQAAAAEGSEEAREFLKTGYHTGYRDLNALGAGTPTASALAPLSEDNARLWRSDSESHAAGRAVPARKLVKPSTTDASPPPAAPPPQPSAESPHPLAADIQGQRLTQHDPLLASPGAPGVSAALGLLLLLLGSFLVGLLRQKWLGRASGASTPAL